MIREENWRPNRRGGVKATHQRGRKNEESIGGQPSQGSHPERSGKEVTEGRSWSVKQPGREQYQVAPRGVCFVCDRSRHYKGWCPNGEQGETVAKSGE